MGTFNRMRKYPEREHTGIFFGYVGELKGVSLPMAEKLFLFYI